MKRLGWLAATAVLLIVVTLVWVGVRFSGGEPYPAVVTEPRYPAQALEKVLEYPEPLGNLAVDDEGRVYFTVHPESRPSGHKVLVWDGEAFAPFPDAARQDSLFQTPLGMVIDRQGRVWTIDHGFHGLGDPRLLAFDPRTGEVVHDHRFSGAVAPMGSFLQDLQVSPNGDTVYIADVGLLRGVPGLVVYDVVSGTARRVLDGHPSVMPQDWLIRTPSREMKFLGGLFVLKPGVDGLALSRDGRWLFYGAMTHDTLYRVPTAALRAADLAAEQLDGAVQPLVPKPLNDGMSIDNAGNVYLTDVEHQGVYVISPDGDHHTLVQHPDIRWADALSFGPDNMLYILDSAIPEQMLRSKAHMAAQGPYAIYRLQLPVGAPAGQ
ncbi:MAG: L-dopachrome tautomerase-related protein [Alcanivoracaceae bacterium]|nr:L-dopachrome tautomerase-related protein [Alcanivoracaceae bacterium]